MIWVVFGTTKPENFVFICLCSKLAVSLDKIGCVSAEPNLNTLFSFVSALNLLHLWIR